MAVSLGRQYYFLVKLVWIFSLFSAGFSQLEDVADGRKQFATQIGTYSNYTADKALDGNTNADINAGHCAQPHDTNEQDAWWMVDLGSQFAIHSVVIYSGSRGSNEVVLGYISVRVSDSADIADHRQSDQCARWDSDRFPKESSPTLKCDHAMNGQYVSIQRTDGEHTNKMILCEVKVMGTNAYNTLCDNCRDEACVQTEPCNECEAGFKPKECREPCDAGFYGTNCAEECSEGCEDTCDNVSGECSCKDWWDGDKCTTEVGVYKIPRYKVTFSDETDSSAIVTWRTIRDLPDNMKQYYAYVLEYRLEGESEWTVDRTLAHDPDADDTQHHTLTGLEYNTMYEVQVRSVRSLRGQTETTQDTPDAELTTKCKAPDKPIDMKITHTQDGTKVDLTVTWQAPDHYCDSISDNDIMYRLSSESENNWQDKDLSSSATSAEIRDLDPGEYVVKLTVTNDQQLTSSDTKTYIAGLDYDTNCNNCNDDNCDTDVACLECTAGYKKPECKSTCESGFYGVNCEEQCSGGCENTCDIRTGTCSCRQWWGGNKCAVEIGALKLPTDAPIVSTLTSSTAVIKWQQITNVPDGLSDHYQYVIEYKEETSSDWTQWRTRHSHDPSLSLYQQDTLTGLVHNTPYDVQVKSYRVLGNDREKTGDTADKRFKTLCQAPTKPRDAIMTFEEKTHNVTLSITWKHPETVGCNKINDYDIWYRLTSAASDDWTVIEEPSASATSYTLRDLDSGDYVVRVVITNDDDLSGFSELFYGPETTTTVTTVNPGKSPTGGSNSSSIGLIVGVVIGVLLLVILLLIMGFILYRRRRHRGFYQENCKSTEELDPPSSDNEELDTPSYEETSEEPITKRKKTPLLPISPKGFVSRIQKQKAETVKAEASKKPAIPAKPSIPSVIEEEDAPTRTSVSEIVEPTDEDVEDTPDQTNVENTSTPDPTEDEETSTAALSEDEDTPTPDQIGDTRIRLDCLATYIKDKKNETDGFKKEYILLKKELQYPCIEGQKEEHRLLKNRYRNIVAYDHSRVVLDILDDDPDSSYINASYMPGYKDEVNEYIACQGPKPDTINDTWRMIWQLNSNCIVMVTNLTENAAVKCEQYWPDDGETEEYGDITVDTLQSEPYADYTERIFQAEKEGETRTIHQFHFTSWIDRSVPEHAFPLLHFRRKVVAFNRQRTGPMMVHCSAGVGRTGTFIAIDYLAKEAEAEDHVDVRRCVEQMREQRPNMVQTLAQYIFVYESVLELTEIGNTAIPCDKLAGEFEDLSSDAGDYANVSKLQQQFELLNQRRVVPVDDEIAGLQAENKPKNRCLNIVPSDRYRPYLATWQGQSDYINAAYIDGYRTRDTYIVTQTPMPDTLTDFWRLVFEHNCGTIVMMEYVDDSDQTVATYWPELVGNKQENGPLTIELLEEDTSGQPGLVTRDFQLAPSKKAKKPPVKVKQFQLTAWESDDELTSDLQEQFLKLLEQLESWQKEADKGPILVHCVNGASRSGLFCAANYMIDMIKKEQEVDVFYVVRHIRAHRPQLIDSLEQYKFLHQLALTYMARSNVYQNVMVAGN